MSFKHPTYIVLDLPQYISEIVMDIRKEHKDEFRSALPVEITVAGSSGVGIVSEEQSEEMMYNKLNEIAKNTKPIKLSFNEVKRFPGSDIFVLKLSDEKEVLELHNKLRESGIKFEETPLEFEPHCTLRSRSPISKEDEVKLYSIEIQEAFVVNTLSVYMLDKLPIKKLYTVKLTG